MSTTKIELPFAGFYESWHDARIDDAIESAFTDEETGTELKPGYDDYIFMADVDWSMIRREYCEHYVAAFADEFDLELTFDGLQSPKFYNFSTDRVFALIPTEQADKLRAEVWADAEWADVVREHFTSRSGFSSFYDAELTSEDWTGDLDECQWRVVIQHWLDMKHRDDPLNEHEWNEREYQITEDFELYGWESINDAINAIETYAAKEAAK